MPSVQGMSMFHRRLALVAVLIGAGSLIPVARLAQLAVVKGEKLAEQAESRLSTTRLIETTRGRVLDRKGRVLAVDRPGFDVRVDYSLISGQWAFLQAAREAKKVTERWNELSAVQREAAVQALVPAYAQRLERSWDALARFSGVSRQELEERRQAVVRRVSAMAAELTEINRTVAEREALERGRELSDINPADLERPIREQTVPHALVRGLDDTVAFAFPTGERAEVEGLLPGMRIVDGATREYPLESMKVSIDRVGFPGSLRSPFPLEVEADGVATALVGWMRTGLTREDYDKGLARPLWLKQDGVRSLDLSGYLDTDGIGVTGVERAAEGRLRGSRGVEVEQLDTGQKRRVDRRTGGDVTLTIDAALQARVQALMGAEAGLTTVQPFHNNKAMAVGTRLPAGVVVLDVASGDVLALASTPAFTRRQLRDDAESILTYDADVAFLESERRKAEAAGQPAPSAASVLPFLNRAVGKPYAPGSIVKPLVLNFAAAQGVYRDAEGERIACTGHLYPNQPNLMRCWIYKQPPHTTHNAQLGHDLDATDAIMASCNIFFFTLGQRLGEGGGAHLADWYGRIGVGSGAPLGVGYQYPGEVLGAMPRSDADSEEIGEGAAPRRGRQASPYGEADFAMLGIGQGPIAWTPLHAADAYCTLARGGVRLTPRIRADAGAPAQARTDLGFHPEAVRLALRGLERSVGEERGTGHHIAYVAPDGVTMRENTFNLPGVRVWGKSGTADSGVRSGSDPSASIDHSWFVVLAGPAGGEPRYAVAVMVENGGSGGRVAGPLCNQVLWQLFAEGYF